MNRFTMLRSFVIFSLFIIATLGQASAQATTQTTTTQTPVDTIISNSCIGGAIHITGQLNVVSHVTVTDEGDTITTQHINLHGSGENAEGTQYVFNQTTTITFNQQGPPPLEFTFVDYVRVTSQGTNDNFRLRMLIHVTINANGETTATVSDFERVCD